MHVQQNTDFLAVLLISIMVFGITLVSPVQAQEEPTPIPEPTEEAPVAAVAQEEPEAAAEPAAAVAPAAAAVPEPVAKEKGVPTVYREKTLITTNGRAEMNGYIELVVTPNGEDPIRVRANIVAKTKTKKITKALFDEINFALGDRYKVKQTGDRTIRITAKKKTPPVAVELKTQNLAGVSVMIGQG